MYQQENGRYEQREIFCDGEITTRHTKSCMEIFVKDFQNLKEKKQYMNASVKPAL